MNCLRLSLLVLMLSTLTACAGGGSCDKRKLYGSSHENEPVSVPGDLDTPEATKELVIPEPAPSSPRSEDDGCLEAPPKLPASAD